MPRFSVIVPAHQVQACLPACLESVLSQSYADLELIVVDDCSPDACGEIAGRFAARDARVRPLRLAENLGAGGARTAGLGRARGDYLLFLDGDDLLAADALRAVADRLKETGDPDVLVHGFAPTDWAGRPERGQQGGQLTERGPAPFRLEDRPGLLRVPAAAWNTACRREFTETHGLTFGTGRREAVPWTYPALMAAESIATLDRVCVLRRRRPGGTRQDGGRAAADGSRRLPATAGSGRPRTTGRGAPATAAGAATTARDSAPPPAARDDVFGSYERVFAFVDERPALAAWRPALFGRMVADAAAEFTGAGAAWGRAGRAAFLRRARDHYRRHRPPGVPVPLRARPRHALVRFGAHRTYRVLRRARSLAGRGGARTVRLARGLRTAGLRLHYRVQRLLPVRDDRAVFAAYEGEGHCCNPGALEAAFRGLAPHIRTAWITRPEHRHTVPPGTRGLAPGTAAYWTALARSRYLVDNAGLDRHFVKRRGQVRVRTQTGTPLKQMGLDLCDRPAAGRDTDPAELVRDAGSWDYVLSANRHTTLTWERVYPGGYRTLEYGQPRNDVFQRATSADVSRLREALGVPEGSVAILYAPTFRDYRRSQVRALDLERVVRRLGPRFVVLARAHRTQPGPLGAGARIIDVSGHPSVEKLCLASDALVTDYSSIMFDYAALDRPIVIHADDWEAYEAARGTYFDLRAFPPGAVARSEDELIDIFATGHWRGSRSAQVRAAFRERFSPWDDGRAAERVVRHVVLGERGVPPVEPLAARHPVPSAVAALGRFPTAGVPEPTAPLSAPPSAAGVR